MYSIAYDAQNDVLDLLTGDKLRSKAETGHEMIAHEISYFLGRHENANL